jgi:hypothetical protein
LTLLTAPTSRLVSLRPLIWFSLVRPARLVQPITEYFRR